MPERISSGAPESAPTQEQRESERRQQLVNKFIASELSLAFEFWSDDQVLREGTWMEETRKSDVEFYRLVRSKAFTWIESVKQTGSLSTSVGTEKLLPEILKTTIEKMFEKLKPLADALMNGKKIVAEVYRDDFAYPSHSSSKLTHWQTNTYEVVLQPGVKADKGGIICVDIMGIEWRKHTASRVTKGLVHANSENSEAKRKGGLVPFDDFEKSSDSWSSEILRLARLELNQRLPNSFNEETRNDFGEVVKSGIRRWSVLSEQ